MKSLAGMCNELNELIKSVSGVMRYCVTRKTHDECKSHHSLNISMIDEYKSPNNTIWTLMSEKR